MNKKEAVLYSRVAHATYLNRWEGADFLLTAKFRNDGTDTQGLFGVAFGDTLVVGFRGSEETGTADWVTNLKFVLADYPFAPKGSGAEVHYGFTQAYISVRDAVLKTAGETTHQKIVTVGHSLGGALASLAALDITLNVSGKKVTSFTFGSPKVGNSAFAALYNKHVPQTYRIVNDTDIIPTIPPLGYQHVGRLQQLGQSGPAGKGFMGAISERIQDHLPHNYTAALQKLL